MRLSCYPTWLNISIPCDGKHPPTNDALQSVPLALSRGVLLRAANLPNPCQRWLKGASCTVHQCVPGMKRREQGKPAIKAGAEGARCAGTGRWSRWWRITRWAAATCARAICWAPARCLARCARVLPAVVVGFFPSLQHLCDLLGSGTLSCGCARALPAALGRVA